MLNGPVCSELPIQQTGHIPRAVTQKIVDHLESDNEPSESGESCLTNWYSVF
jgi:hypothetical protein